MIHYLHNENEQDNQLINDEILENNIINYLMNHARNQLQ